MANDQTHLKVVGGSFTTEDSSTYDLDRRYVYSGKDKRPFQCVLPQHLLSRMERLVTEKTIPEYTSVGAIVRDCVAHRMHYLAESGRDRTSLEAIEAFVRDQEIERMNVQTAVYSEKFDGHEKALTGFVEISDWSTLVQYLNILQRQLAVGEYHYPWDEKLDDIYNRWVVQVPENWEDFLT